MSKAFNSTFTVIVSGHRENAYDTISRFLKKFESELRVQADTLIGDDDYLNEQLVILVDVRFARDGEHEADVL